MPQPSGGTIEASQAPAQYSSPSAQTPVKPPATPPSQAPSQQAPSQQAPSQQAPGEAEQSEPVAQQESSGTPEATVSPATSTPEAQPLAAESGLPFTGYVLGTVIAAGLACLAAGLVLRRWSPRRDTA